METMVLLVFLGIVWAAVGIYWLRTRIPKVNIGMPSYPRRMGSLDSGSTRRVSAPVVPLRSTAQPADSVVRPIGAPARPGHSLTEPARVAHPGTQQPRGVSSEQARLRRRNVLAALAVAAAATLVGVFVIGGATMILAHLIADALLLGYVMLLVQYQREIEFDRTNNLPVYAAARSPLGATGTDGRY